MSTSPAFPRVLLLFASLVWLTRHFRCSCWGGEEGREEGGGWGLYRTAGVVQDGRW